MGKSEKKVISTEKAPKAIGPYSVGIKACHFLYTAGQIGLDPKSGVLVNGGIEEQTRQVMNNLSAILEAAGATMTDVVKTTVFLQDMNDFAKMNAIYGESFKENPPARSTVQVAGLPKGALVEIELVAMLTSNDCQCDS